MTMILKLLEKLDKKFPDTTGGYGFWNIKIHSDMSGEIFEPNTIIPLTSFGDEQRLCRILGDLLAYAETPDDFTDICLNIERGIDNARTYQSGEAE